MKPYKYFLDSFMPVLKNSISISLTRITVSVSLFILAIIVARRLGPVEFGKYSIAISLYAIFELISDLGLENLAIKEISQDESKSGLFFSNGIALGVFSTSACFLLLILTANLMSYPGEIKNVIYLTGILLLPAFVNFLSETIFIALRKTKFLLYVALIREASLLALSILFLMQGRGIFSVIMAIFISRIIGLCLFIYFFAKIKLKLIPRIDIFFLKDVLGMIPVFVLISVVSSVFFEIDTLILSKIVTISEVGIYSIAKKIVRANFLFIFGAATAMFPVISQSFSSSKGKILHLYRLFLKYIFLLSIALLLITLLFAPLVIRLFLGRKFMDALPIIKILIWSVLPWSLSFLLSRFLISCGQQNKDLLALGIGLLSFAVFGIFLSFKWANYGMAFASIISMAILAGAHYFLTKKYVITPLKGT